MFAPLTLQEIENIVRLQFGFVKSMLQQQSISIDITDNAVKGIAKNGFDPHYGARPIKRIIQKEILNQLSKEILANKIDKEKRILIDLKEGSLVFTD